MAVSIRELTGIEELRELAELFAVVWGRPGEPPISSDILKALAHSGNYVSGAYLDQKLVGGLVGWFGGSPPQELHLHSHILGVLSGSDAHGLGSELKQHQRRWCLARNVKVMEWTTDPLVRRNAYFNLTKLGAQAREYLVNVYGEMRDDINAGEESDRLLISWRLDSDSAVAAAAGRVLEPSIEDLREGGAVVALLVGEAGEPVTGSSSARVLLCQVPDDIVALRRSDPKLARSWRMAQRKTFTAAIAAGYEVSGATRSGWYVLEAGAN
ncbi:MAG TPA: GNAT family N-acetyltransferase [Candidatus Acidoferrum sp.]|nr:GNAT family N-acetyltransferase [Candidatus Acidoferrum sp.]